MAQLSNDCFAFGGELMPIESARALIETRVAPAVGTETVPLLEADGRVLAQGLVAPISLPPFDNSAVDGYAVKFDVLASAGETSIPVLGRIAAGTSSAPEIAPGAVRIFTGAPMPAGFDTVFMQEDVIAEQGKRVRLPSGLARGANRRQAGEDLAAGEPALPEGRRLTPGDVALLAALGLDRVPVRQRLRVAICSTGDEIVPPGEALGPAKVYDANRFLLIALLRRLGCAVSDLGILPDRRGDVAEAFRSAAEGHDLLVSSGGVSTGEEDHVRDAVEGVGALTFWRLGIKPGRPVAMGVVAGVPFIGLPGNPVAAFVTFVHVARPLVARLSGEAWAPPIPFAVRSGFSYRKKEGRREFVRVRLARDGTGALVAHKHPREGAGVITSLTETHGLAELSESVTRVAEGESIAFLPYALLV